MKYEIKQLSKSYGTQKALDRFNYSFETGVYGILGPNGAGKSTLMNLMTDSIKRETGEILVDGIDILKLGKKYRYRVGYMAQEQGLYPQMTAWEFLNYVAMLKGLPKRKSGERIRELISVVNLEDAIYKKIGGFSGGMKRRILLVQALLGNPDLLILDEPTAGLDPKERIRIRNFISEIAQERTVILATHVVSDIECIADKVLLMKKGELIKVASPSELIGSIQNKVSEKLCTPEELQLYQRRYGLGNVYQRAEGQVLRLVGDQQPEGFESIKDAIGLEEVYLYYFERI
ncbi:MAG: ATP-binding cassette domain-containing protein [Lachnospiraceae bacterium]